MGRTSSLFAICLAVVGLSSVAAAQLPDWTVAVVGRGSFTTSSKVFFNPDASSEILRGEYAELNHVYGLGLELRWRPFDGGFFISLGSEYLSSTTGRTQVVRSMFGYLRVPGEDGYRVVPVELGGNIYVPLGTNAVRLAVGGGIGGYVTQRILSVSGVKAEDVTTPVSFGIHVRTTFEYRVADRLYVTGELRFRDPEAVTTSRFVTQEGTYRGTTFQLPQNELRSRINVDGMNLSIGMLVELF